MHAYIEKCNMEKIRSCTCYNNELERRHGLEEDVMDSLDTIISVSVVASKATVTRVQNGLDPFMLGVFRECFRWFEWLESRKSLYTSRQIIWYLWDHLFMEYMGISVKDKNLVTFIAYSVRSKKYARNVKTDKAKYTVYILSILVI